LPLTVMPGEPEEVNSKEEMGVVPGRAGGRLREEWRESEGGVSWWNGG